MTTRRNLASDANAAIDQWELKIQNAHATHEQQESLAPVGRQSLSRAEVVMLLVIVAAAVAWFAWPALVRWLYPYMR